MKRSTKTEKTNDKRKLPLFDYQVVLEICLVCGLLLLCNQIRISRQTKEIMESVQNPQPSIFWYTASEASDAREPLAESTAAQYVLNTATMKIHSPECRYAAAMQQTNRREISAEELEQALAEGYTFCGACRAKTTEPDA